MANKQNLVALAVGFVAGAVAFSSLPEHSPRPGFDRLMVAFLLPVAATLTYGVLLVIRRKDPLREPGTSAALATDIVISCAIHFMVALHVVMLLGVLTRSPAAGKSLVLLLVGSTLVIVGNVLPRTRPNMVVGLRTEHTLTDRALWIRTHRRLGYAAVAFGVMIMLSLLAV